MHFFINSSAESICSCLHTISQYELREFGGGEVEWGGWQGDLGWRVTWCKPTGLAIVLARLAGTTSFIFTFALLSKRWPVQRVTLQRETTFFHIKQALEVSLNMIS